MIRGVFEGVWGDRLHRASLSPIYEKIKYKKKYIKFTHKINILAINKAQIKNFAWGFYIFQDGSDFDYTHLLYDFVRGK